MLAALDGLELHELTSARWGLSVPREGETRGPGDWERWMVSFRIYKNLEKKMGRNILPEILPRGRGRGGRVAEPLTRTSYSHIHGFMPTVNYYKPLFALYAPPLLFQNMAVLHDGPARRHQARQTADILGSVSQSISSFFSVFTHYCWMDV